MATFNQNLKTAAGARAANSKTSAAIYTAKLNLLKQNPGASAEQIAAKLAAKLLTQKNMQDRLQQSLQTMFENDSPQSLINNWNAKIPVLLLPLRIETKFMTTVSRIPELWVRIYPDDIAVQQHEPLLSQKELEEGKKYWQLLFDAGKKQTVGDDARKAAWENLKSLFGPNRAAWIARQTVPANWAAKDQLTESDTLVFTDMPLVKNGEWTEAPRTKLLPEKFVVTLFKNGAKVHEQTGNLVPDTLMLGHDPFQGSAAFTKTDVGIEFAKEFSWMSDFEEAVKVGMGMKIQLRNEFFADNSKQRIEQLAVLGVYLSATPEQSALLLEELFENHRYTEGLAIVPQGTATNNTEDSSAGFKPNEDPQTNGFFDISSTAPFENNEQCDGNRLAKALGISASVIEGIANGTCRDNEESVTMNKVLFPGTIGYYFDTLLDQSVPDKYVALLKSFFENHVTGAGPLPAIRIGDQPYGILVTSDFSRWQTNATTPDLTAMYNTIQRVLTFFSAEWETQSKKLLYVGREKNAAGNPLTAEEIFLDIVGLEASSVKFERRTGFMNDLPEIKRTAPGFASFKAEAVSNETVVKNQLTSLGAVALQAGSYQLFDNILFKPENKVFIPGKNLVDGLPFSETRELKQIEQINANYLNWLANVASIDVLEKQDFGDAKAPNFLLYLLGRHSLLLELRRLALQLLAKRQAVIRFSAFDKTYLNLNGSNASKRDLTIWEVLHADINFIQNGIPGIILKKLGDQLLKENDTVQELKKNFRLLSGLPTARLERLLTGHLDCLTYRLDAWQTGLFYEKLNRNRNDITAPAKGIYAGAFGYLENLEPAAKTIAENAVLPQNLQPPAGSVVYSADNSAGLLQAPSLDHAAAAALLMAGYRNHATPQEPGAFSVNLSSSRVRKATQILEGVRNGQSLEALLGYQFERGCHDHNLDQYILAFRLKYPVENQYNQQEGEITDANVFRPVQPNVVNGLKLAKEQNITLFADIIHGVTPGIDINQVFDSIVLEVNKLSDTLDAVKDLLLSESVFQAASGNTARTAAVLESLRDGSIPPEPGILKTPRRTRFAFNHVVSIHFPQLPGNVSPWGAAIPPSPRSVFEAGLNQWLSKAFGNPVNIICWVNHKNEIAQKMTALKKITLADLKMQPVDFLMEAAKGTSMLEQRIAAHYRALLNLAPEQQVNIDLAKKAAGSKRSFTIIILLAQTLHAVLSQSRPVHAGDYMPFTKGTGSSNKQGYHVEELNDRVTATVSQLKTALQDFGSIILNDKPKNEDNPANLQALFVQWQSKNFADDLFDTIEITGAASEQIIHSRKSLTSFDIPDAWPLNMPGGTSESNVIFLTGTARCWKAAQLLLNNAESLHGTINGVPDVEEKTAALLKIARLLLGGAFPVMPAFSYQNENEVKLAVRDRKQLLSYYSSISGLPDTVIPEDWLQSVSAVRSKINRWELARSLAEMNGGGEITLSAIQLPYRKKDNWLAVQFPPADANGNAFGITTDTISCAIFGADALKTSALQSGLLIDEWSESIPVETETTGIAFNYNQPDSMPPQSLLLAVYPGIENNWNWDALLGTVMDSFKRAKMRAVEPKHLQQHQLINHFLPGIIAPVNTKGNNISLDFAIASDEYLTKVPADLSLYRPHVKITGQ